MIDFIIDILQDIANLLEGVRDKNNNKTMPTIAILLLILSIIIGLIYYSK